jgi:hypothetical protein
MVARGWGVQTVHFAHSKEQGHSHPRRVTIKVTPTEHPASCLSSWLRLMPITADSSALDGYSNIRILVLNAIIVPPK